MSDGSDQHQYGLVVSFPDQSESFVLGFEAGGVWERLKAGETPLTLEIVHTKNREVIDRMATAEGYEIVWGTTSDPDQWSCCEMRKVKPSPGRPNPHGLRVVKAD